MTKKNPSVSSKTDISFDIGIEDDLGGVVEAPKAEELETLELSMEDDATPEETPEGLEVLEGMPSPDEVPYSVDMSRTDISSLVTEVDDEVIRNLTWLIYGRNGTGKTTLLSTVEGMLILAAEDGTLSIRTKVDPTKTKKVRIDTWEKMEEVYWLLKKGRWTDEGIYIPTKTGEFLVKSIGIDTITKLANICMRYVVLGEKAKDPTKDILKPTQNDWGKMAQRMSYWLQMFKELPVQKVWLCQERTSTDDSDNDDYTVFPDVSKSLRSYIMGEADVVARAYIKNVEGKAQFRILFGSHETYFTKDRTGVLGYAIANPRLDSLYKKVFGEV